jgi:hypothetical protein
MLSLVKSETSFARSVARPLLSRFVLVLLNEFALRWAAFMGKTDFLIEPPPKVDHLAALAAERRIARLVQEKTATTSAAGQSGRVPLGRGSLSIHQRDPDSIRQL